MNRRSFMRAIPSVGALLGLGAVASVNAADVIPSSPARSESATNELVSTLYERQDVHYDELAAMILANEEHRDVDEYPQHIVELFRWEINGYCMAMRRAYPSDASVNFSVAWATERAQGRVPLTDGGRWRLVEPNERVALIAARQALA